ncbi:MAG: primosomal protein N' [Oscillospiraceae bacterium]|nr:primosomal protein N' [Oscillospiraceae bacterium]
MIDVQTALVAVSGTAYSFDSLFTYVVPQHLKNRVQKGVRVLVPFSKSNSLREAMVFELKVCMNEDCSNLKVISDVLDDKPVLSDEMLEMALYLSETTFCTIYDATKAVLPPAMRYKKQNEYFIDFNAENINFLGLSELEYIEALKTLKKPSIQIENDLKAGHSDAQSLLKKEVIRIYSNYAQKCSQQTVKTADLSDAYKSGQLQLKLTYKQQCVVDYIDGRSHTPIKEICENCSVTSAVVSNLEKYGVIITSYVNASYAHSIQSTRLIDDIELSLHQNAVFEKVALHINESKPKAFLLHGITGSGKTAVFAKLIDNAVKCGKSVIYLVPEISLTPQMSQYFISLFGDRVALIHSGLSQAKRLEEYNRIKNNEADIVIGTRSAVFAPLANIGLIIIDEEGERTYKSESSPRFSTVNVAKKRCRTHNCVLLLASATPTIESYYLAQKGVYELLTLTQRYHNNPLPQTEIVDMSCDELCGKYMSFSQTLKLAVEKNLARNEQTILLLNRRGYHTIITCRDCHKAIFCPNCSIPMTYHKTGNKLVCHYCGHNEIFENECPECHGVHLKPGGFGTQKLEEEVAELFPNARILRMDADTSSNMQSYEKAFSDFANGDYDILLGTQMIGKGLDFPNVTLVGVLSVDKALFAGDFKSYEHTFSLITQVIGRSGRGEKPGRAILQTYIPDHYVLSLAAAQDYREFYAQEIAARKVFLYPPICDLCVIGFSGKDDTAVEKAAQFFVSVMREYITSQKPNIALRVLGPSRCGLEKIDEQYRYRLILKCKNTPDFRSFISSVIKKSGTSKHFRNVSMYCDLNGEVGY